MKDLMILKVKTRPVKKFEINKINVFLKIVRKTTKGKKAQSYVRRQMDK